ncbi:DNA/RNA non-specific endonuclease [Rufibacter sp. DG15C]|uniref:DNA/RNA non-specific endonuclease n=1 Tax=Rufibacter sp. DG15C TaxID=1379909 RepID=UPI00082A228A|nr:DNA/RNA non-specific endonuclease [Rufibacter sp. DG15C]
MGHNTPSADRTKTLEDNSATFLITDMVPQVPSNNQQTWAGLEDHTRNLAQAGNEVYVIMGSYGVEGAGSDGTKNTIDNGRVTVPSMIWKVIMVIPLGDNYVSRVTENTRVISVNTPNINTVNSSWGGYRTMVDAIEAVNGYDLLTELPDDIEARLESKTEKGPTF